VQVECQTGAQLCEMSERDQTKGSFLPIISTNQVYITYKTYRQTNKKFVVCVCGGSAAGTRPEWSQYLAPSIADYNSCGKLYNLLMIYFINKWRRSARGDVSWGHSRDFRESLGFSPIEIMNQPESTISLLKNKREKRGDWIAIRPIEANSGTRSGHSGSLQFTFNM
jgi:hypothetical protein